MKLVELLACELGEWPSEVQAMAQNPNTAIPYFNKLRVEWDTTMGFWTGSDGHSIIDFGETTKLSEDHTTAIVTREMWEAEKYRLFGNCEDMAKEAFNHLQSRDRIYEIDTLVESLEEERAALVQGLEDEGFKLIIGKGVK